MTTGNTPNYGLFLGDDSTLMNNPDLVLKNNWTKIQGIPKQPIVTGLPFSGYNAGDKIYRQGYNSTFICLGYNPDWGHFWRPVQARYSPWITVGTAILKDSTNYALSNQPLQYRISNDGRFIMRGSISRVAGTFPNHEATPTNLDLLKNISSTAGFSVNPTLRGQFSLACQPQPASPTKPHIGFFVMDVGGDSYLHVFNADASITQVFFNSVSWDIKSGNGY